MKIAVVGLSPKVGGVETFIINMFRSLYQKHDFYFLTSYDEDVCYKDEILKNNGKIIIPRWQTAIIRALHNQDD